MKILNLRRKEKLLHIYNNVTSNIFLFFIRKCFMDNPFISSLPTTSFFSPILGFFSFTNKWDILVLLEDRVPKPHQFVEKPLHSSLHIFDFKILAFGFGSRITISVINTSDYINYISSLISTINTTWNNILGTTFNVNNDIFNNHLSNNSDFTSVIKFHDKFNYTCENKFINNLPHFFLSSKSKYGNIGLGHTYPDILNGMYDIVCVSTPLISILAPYILYITLPRTFSYINTYMVRLDEQQLRANRLRELNNEFDNRYNAIMTHIDRTRNNWASYWNYVETLRGHGIDLIIEANTGEIDILLPLNPTQQVEQRADRLSTQTNVLVGQLVDIARLIARNRFTASLIQRDDPTFVASDEVIINDLTPILEQTQNLYNIFDFEETVRETLHDINNSYNQNEPGDSSHNTGNKRDRSDFDPDYDNAKRMKYLDM